MAQRLQLFVYAENEPGQQPGPDRSHVTIFGCGAQAFPELSYARWIAGGSIPLSLGLVSVEFPKVHKVLVYIPISILQFDVLWDGLCGICSN
jgi:hypothetical protein